METLNLQVLIEKTCGNMFDFHPKFYEEFKNLVVESGVERIIIKQLLTKLKMIVQLGNVDCGLKWLEKLKNYDNMYSLHIQAGHKNYRLLFSKTSNKKIFLHMFYEKSGKYATSYDKHVPIALERISE